MCMGIPHETDTTQFVEAAEEEVAYYQEMGLLVYMHGTYADQARYKRHLEALPDEEPDTWPSHHHH